MRVNRNIEEGAVKIDLMGLGEIRWPGRGKCEKKDTAMFYSGIREEDVISRHRVAALISCKVKKHIKHFTP